VDICAKPLRQLIQRYLLPIDQYFELKHDESSYLLHRNAYVQTNGKINHCLNGLISLMRPIEPLPSLAPGLLDNNMIPGILDQLSISGGYAYCQPDICKEHMKSLVRKLDEAPKAEKSSARTMMHDWSSLREEPLVQSLIADRTLKSVADNYLGCNTILNMVTAWKTTYIEESVHNTSGDAMMFHFDADHNRFLKIFIYLSEVGRLDGPHMFVPRTSSLYRKELPLHLRRDGRFSNIELIEFGLAPEFITGQEGTLIFADTHCLHRGTRVAKGHCRYILQLQFVDSVAGSKPIHNSKEMHEINAAFNNI
jgi:hypothetical protein